MVGFGRVAVAWVFLYLVWLGVMDRRSSKHVGWQRESSIWILLEICVQHASGFGLTFWKEHLDAICRALESSPLNISIDGATNVNLLVLQLSVAPTLGGLGFTRGV